MERIVSLIPSATEIVCALGFQEKLVARSHECNFPAGVERLPVCTEPTFNPEGTSAEIDRRVKSILEQALSVYRVNADVLKQARPDVIVTQSQCEVCAVSMREVEQAARDYLNVQPLIVSLAPNALDDVFADIQRVADALGAAGTGAQVVARLRQRIDAIAARTRRLTSRPTVACIEWIEPLMSAGNWMPELVEIAGGVNLFGEAGKHSPWMKWEELAAKNPDVILLAPCGFNVERSLKELPALQRAPQWASLRAVREGRAYVADGSQYFNRPGPRIVESAEILAEMLHPELFNFGHRGRGWQPL